MSPVAQVPEPRPRSVATDTPTATPAPTPSPALDTLGRLVDIQHYQSVAVLGALVVLIVAIYEYGPRLKDHLGDETGELVQSLVVTGLGVVAAALLVAIWNLNDEVLAVVREVVPDAQTSVKVMVSLLVLSVAYTVTRMTKRFVKLGEGKDYISSHQQEILHHVLQIAVFLPAVYFVFLLWEVPFQSVLLGAGTLGIVVGLAARQTLGAVLAGFVLLFSRPFRVGDWVVIDDEEGVVRDISIVNTRIRTFDHEEVMIPNDEITSSNIVNRTRNGLLRIRTEVGVDYDDDPSHAAEVAEDAMSGVDVLADAREPDVVHKGFGDSAVVLELRYWISDPTIRRKWRAQNAVVDAVKEAFEAEGIKIPYPQRELTGREETDGLRVSGAPVRETSDGEDAESEDAESDGEVESAVEERDEDGTEDDDPDTADPDRPDPGPYDGDDSGR